MDDWSEVIEGTSLGEQVRVHGLDGDVTARAAWDDERGVQVLLDSFVTLTPRQADRLANVLHRLAHVAGPSSD